MPIHSPPLPADLVPIGYIAKAHGIRGEIVFVLTAESKDLASGTLYFRHRNGGRVVPYTVARSRVHHGTFLLLLEGVTTRNEAELLRSHTVYVSPDRLAPLDEDEVYLRELPGLTVFAVGEGGAERELGVITSADVPAGQVLWTIETADGKEILFPAVEEFVLSIDTDERAARVSPPPGLLDLSVG